MNRPTGLRVEHLDEALGITERRPRLSWRLPEGAGGQLAYRIRSLGADTGRVPSDRHLLVPWPGGTARSGRRVEWQVKVWTERGESEWSDAAPWEWGLLGPSDWTARWIEPHEDSVPRPGERPAYVLRRGFRLERPVRSARLYATAHGVYEAELNGVRVGDLELTPGFTSYHHRLQVQTYDITHQLRRGGNDLRVLLSDGWYRGVTGALQEPDGYGDEVALLAQLVVTHPDGSRTVVGTGRGWHSAESAVTAADLLLGQTTDLRRTPCGWRPVRLATGGVYDDFDRLTSSPAPPVRRVETLRPAAVTLLPGSGRQIVDLGQNINGWVRLNDTGPAGSTVTLTHGEALGPDGDVTLDHLTAHHYVTGEPFPLHQRDRVTASDRPGESFEPRHTTHGFQYVRIEGHPRALGPDDLTGVVVHTDLRRTGWFDCDHDDLNRLHEAAVWSLRGNACDIPTDCPQRERAGWTGDWQLYLPTAAFLYDVAGFSVKWLRDLAADQWPDGNVPCIVPRGPSGVMDALDGSAGWGDAAVIVPWELWQAYGDLDILREQYPSMTAWVDHAARCARGKQHPDRAANDPYLWDTGHHFGEWLEPGGTEVIDPTLDHSDVATAFLHRSADLLARSARLLGRGRDAERYEEIAAGALRAWQAACLAPDGGLTPSTQATHVRALAFGLVPERLREAVADRLAALVKEADTHLGTGFLATPDLLPVLADHGHLDLAYELLLRRTPPSWLGMLDRGATTVWESWEGIDEDGAPHGSLNHYSKGAVISFLHTRTSGIRLLEPGYRRFLVEPRPGGGMRRAEAEHDSPYGRIRSAWRIEQGTFHLDVTVPAGTRAEIRLPDGTRTEVTPGTHHFGVPGR
ncbi:family 78 glycoside hydrolase catalytic domain [Streptomyces sp. GQFP]|uniref:family 78 glycoside hydrolase catalytic domain n=1 Tax=Streptomyces sp. GQFP TaxID=2907545 RepID=UPI001F38A744|nr:family 78 glycoside hydrolase catalytic domain [Streptomyces sp. GQFP]UIX29410.1 glycoside hydrolase family 78 protein [Streptomyces sp. GQFP]